MSVEVRPLGVKCNLSCSYCYQNATRESDKLFHSYDLDRMKEAIAEHNSSFTLFGGEALLLPEDDLENLWAWGFERYKSNGIQTNGTLINDNHIRMFKQYNVHVGFSIDGPDELNDARWNGTLEKTRQATAEAISNLERLQREGVGVSLIANIHRGNATGEKLPKLLDWFRHLDELGVTSARVHILEVENEKVRDSLALSDEENIHAFRALYDLHNVLNVLKIDVFTGMIDMLLGRDNKVTCTWTACDPYNTRAVRGIEGHGQSSNCGRTNKDGVDYTKSDVTGYERYLALYHTPQEYGGCQGCRFFIMCKGQCPGNAIDGDWRNRTEYCNVWRSLIEFLEGELLERGENPLSASPFREEIEARLVAGWWEGKNLYVNDIVNEIVNGKPMPQSGASGHGDSHGDSHGDGHGDTHGDHCDTSSRTTLGVL